MSNSFFRLRYKTENRMNTRRYLKLIVFLSMICSILFLYHLPVKRKSYAQKIKQLSSIYPHTKFNNTEQIIFEDPVPEINNEIEDSSCKNITLKGDMKININSRDGDENNWPPTLEEIAVHFHKDLKLGGYGANPRNCNNNSKQLAVIVPFRDRELHLRYFLHYIHTILQRQHLEYVILVVEQKGDTVFNKGQMMNTGFMFALNMTGMNFDCFIFHDVDMLSEDDRTLYQCKDDRVVHLSHRIDKFEYKLCCGMTVGGVLGFTRDQFTKINGFSNSFYGWGAEDDDMNNRIREVGKFPIYRPKEDFAKFKMIRHDHDTGNELNPKRYPMLQSWAQRQPRDGLNSMDNIDIVEVIKYWTHTRILVKSRPQDTIA